MNRELWLIRAKTLLEEQYFSKPSKRLPVKLSISCGIPKGSAKAIGQCWDPRVAADGTTHVFVCPSLDRPIEVLGVLLHELIHACVGLKEGHGGQFARMARDVGLRGKLTATIVEDGTELHKSLQKILDALGPYPHKALNKHGTGKKKPVRKRLRLVSTTDDTYSVSLLADLVDEHGPPTDPWGNEMILPGKET